MQEPSPRITEEVRMLLSQYLDGELDVSDQQRIEDLIAADPVVKEEYARLKVLRSAMRGTSEKPLHYTRVTDSLWSAISKQLVSDQEQTPEMFDEVFISTYYDGEIPSGDPDFQRFESQLYNNVEANKTLAAIGEISETIRHFGYRLEESCTLDITQTVITRYLQETGHTGSELETLPLAPEVEMLSAYVDRELTAKETIEANKLIEGNAAHQQTIRVFTHLSEAIQNISAQMREQAPDVWPAVQSELSKVVDISAAKKSAPVFPTRKLVMTGTAAALMLLIAASLFQDGVTNPTSRLAARQTSELAAVPIASNSMFSKEYSPYGMNEMGAPAAAPTSIQYRQPSSDDMIEVTLLESDNQKYNPKDIPSAEEFLFSEMEQTQGDSGQVIVGQD